MTQRENREDDDSRMNVYSVKLYIGKKVLLRDEDCGVRLKASQKRVTFEERCTWRARNGITKVFWVGVLEFGIIKGHKIDLEKCNYYEILLCKNVLAVHSFNYSSAIECTYIIYLGNDY